MNKKMIIARVAFIEKCSCGLHGHIVFSDENYSYEFFSCDEGLEEVAESLQDGLIEEDEAKVLREEINKWKFFDDLIFPEVHKIMNALSESNHSTEAIERIIIAIYDLAEQVTDQYLPKENNFSTEEDVQGDRRTYH